ncbi:CDP-alcohol phosphatidyltransferase family protein, partial [Candidatus Bipolaricaulota bacterium]|nr:CDP-alcohol phosphatidyltransferase family protein [Candidatus Bipolaricaulota bacterium]
AIGALLGLTPYAVVIIAVIANITAVQRVLAARRRLR